ncbi:hypothetical protein SBRCBS47491_004446 [Sporothrix bragantina]|uniref:Uncharacterized protein n=1 Tax=Sporothrix bragantina TaxID=671064 RepID=A0ABP0BNN4_9PEZI
MEEAMEAVQEHAYACGYRLKLQQKYPTHGPTTSITFCCAKVRPSQTKAAAHPSNGRQTLT